MNCVEYRAGKGMIPNPLVRRPRMPREALAALTRDTRNPDRPVQTPDDGLNRREDADAASES